MKIVLYSTGCPRCNVLKTKLKNKNVAFEEVSDEEIMISKGFDSVPILEVDKEPYDFKEAVEWINKI